MLAQQTISPNPHPPRRGENNRKGFDMSEVVTNMIKHYREQIAMAADCGMKFIEVNNDDLLLLFRVIDSIADSEATAEPGRAK